jgi:transcriptional regulator with XRE-family HTH domain
LAYAARGLEATAGREATVATGARIAKPRGIVIASGATRSTNQTWGEGRTMALTCDHCGSIIGDKDYITVPFDLTEDKVGGASADDWFYYCEDECSGAVRGVLENLRQFGHRGEESGLRWTLAETSLEVTETEPAPPASDGASQDETENDLAALRERAAEIKDRAGRLRSPSIPPLEDGEDSPAGGVTFGGIRLHPHPASALMKAGILTLEDVAERREVELLAIEGIGEHTVRKLGRELRRKGLDFVPGATLAEIGERIRDLRRAAQLTRNELARALDPGKPNEKHEGHRDYDIYPTHVAGWESGRIPPTSEHLRLLGELLGIPAADFLASYEPKPLEVQESAPKIDGARLKALRLQRNMSQRELGNRLDPEVNQAGVSAWERDKKQPSLRELDQLIAILGVPLAVLESSPGAVR